ncbi:MAG: hypothetical protein LBV49_05475 [Azonexus sp.]|jgi:hypothetical protein|nr:hypothetical protein [Azonexus sp.]
MPDSPDAAPKSPVSRDALVRIGPIWRWLIGLGSVLVLVFLYGVYHIERAIDAFYFHRYSFPVPSIPVIVIALAAVYLLLVAVYGRWQLFFKAK